MVSGPTADFTACHSMVHMPLPFWLTFGAAVVQRKKGRNASISTIQNLINLASRHILQKQQI
jgi:hypothetical protein